MVIVPPRWPSRSFVTNTSSAPLERDAAVTDSAPRAANTQAIERYCPVAPIWRFLAEKRVLLQRDRLQVFLESIGGPEIGQK